MSLHAKVTVDRELGRWVDSGAIAGGEVVIFQDGEYSHVGVGASSDSFDRKGRLYCSFKPVLAILAGLAQQQGLLRLTDPVGRYLGVASTDMAALRLEQLLAHQVRLPPALQKDSATLQARAVAIGRYSLNPSGPATYNAQTSYTLVAAALERVYGDALNNLVKRLIADPLGLATLALVPAPDDSSYTPLQRRTVGKRYLVIEDERRGLSPVNPGQSGVATLADIAKLYADLLQTLRGEGTLLSFTTLREMLDAPRRVGLHELGNRLWGMGFQRDLHAGILGPGWSHATFGHLGTAPRRIVLVHCADPSQQRVMCVRLDSVGNQNDRCVKAVTGYAPSASTSRRRP